MSPRIAAIICEWAPAPCQDQALNLSAQGQSVPSPLLEWTYFSSGPSAFFWEECCLPQPRTIPRFEPWVSITPKLASSPVSAKRVYPLRFWASFIAALAYSFFLSACAPTHTSDSKLEERFRQHESEFENLLAEVQADPNFRSFLSNSLRYSTRLIVADPEHHLAAVESLGLPRERWFHYQEQLNVLGLSGGVLRDEKGSSVEFRVDPGRVYNGDSYKGYWYGLTPPGKVKNSPDAYRIAGADKNAYGGWLVCKPLKGNWYLYLFVSG